MNGWLYKKIEFKKNCSSIEKKCTTCAVLAVEIGFVREGEEVCKWLWYWIHPQRLRIERLSVLFEYYLTPNVSLKLLSHLSIGVTEMANLEFVAQSCMGYVVVLFKTTITKSTYRWRNQRRLEPLQRRNRGSSVYFLPLQSCTILNDTTSCKIIEKCILIEKPTVKRRPCHPQCTL